MTVAHRSGSAPFAAMGRTVVGEDAVRCLVEGLNVLARIVGTTLGPAGRPALIERDPRTKMPELVDHGATLARRIVEVDRPFVNTGVMLGRHVAWRTYEACGDGSAAAVVVAAALARHLHAALASGVDASALVAAVREAASLVDDALVQGARPVRTREAVSRAIHGIMMDDKLGASIAEALEALGPDAAVLVADDPGDGVHLDFTDGARWRKGLLSPAFLGRFASRVALQDVTVVATDLDVRDPADLVPALELAVATPGRAILLVASALSDTATGLLVTNAQGGGALRSAVAVAVPLYGPQRQEAVADLAALTGGRAILAAHGDQLRDITPEHLGRARRAWATADGFGIAGGAGDPGEIDQRLRCVRAEIAIPGIDAALRGRLEERLGTLTGAAATLWIGAPTAAEREALKLRAEAGLRAARTAMEQGAVDGGGLALVRAAACLDTGSGGIPQRAARRALRDALEAPARTILSNAGIRAGPILSQALARPAGTTFDVRTRAWCETIDGVDDPLGVVRAALSAAISGALMAVSVGALVRRRHPLVAAKP